MNLKLDYEQDFQQWIETHITLLRQGKFAEIDVDHLIEELQDMGKGHIHELESRFIVLIAHLLKWQYQYQQLNERWETFLGGSWRSSIIEQRVQIVKLIRENPSLKRKLPDIIAKAYPDAVYMAIKETKLPASTFPKNCPYTLEQLFDDEFYPESQK